MSKLVPDLWYFADSGHLVFTSNPAWHPVSLKEKVIGKIIGARFLEQTAPSSNSGSASDQLRPGLFNHLVF